MSLWDPITASHPAYFITLRVVAVMSVSVAAEVSQSVGQVAQERCALKGAENRHLLGIVGEDAQRGGIVGVSAIGEELLDVVKQSRATNLAERLGFKGPPKPNECMRSHVFIGVGNRFA